MRRRNPLDPLDDIKQWYSELWPMQRGLVWLCAAAVVLVLLLWATK